MLDAALAMRARAHAVCLVAQPASELARRATAAHLAVDRIRLGGWLDPRSLWALRRVIARRRARTLCVNLDKEIRQGALASLGRGVRLVARRGSPDPIKDNWHYRLVYQRCVHRLICNCEALVTQVCDPAPWFDRARVRVIPNGVDMAALEAAAGDHRTARAALALADDAVVVTCVGEVGWRKGQEILLRTAAQLPGSAVVLIVGEGDGRAQLTAQADRMGLLAGGRVRFLGFRDDVPALLRASDILVLPSRREGFPNTLLEGMALGLPVVATRADGIPELVQDGITGALVAVDDEPAFTAKVLRLVGDRALRQRWGEAGRVHAREAFSQPRVMDLVEDALCRW
jgi:glycosyltransferase involved in cell wall biosynthesis